MSSPLTPNERNLLFLLGIGVMAERTGSDAETAADQLDGYAMTINRRRPRRRPRSRRQRAGPSTARMAGRIDGYRRRHGWIKPQVRGVGHRS